MKILVIGICCYGIGENVGQAFKNCKKASSKHLPPPTLENVSIYRTEKDTITVNTERGPVITADLQAVQ